MPVYRNIQENPRRSRRLSHQGPRCYDGGSSLSLHSTYIPKLCITEDGYELLDDSEIMFRFPSEATSADTSASGSPPPPSPSPPSLPRPSDRREPYRVSHSKRKDKNHIPRPPNSFICFRSWYCETQRNVPGRETDEREISRKVGNAWRKLSEKEREPFKEMSLQKKIEHTARYPDYKYAPCFRKSVKPRKKAPRARLAEEAKCDRIVEELFLEQLIVMPPEPEDASTLSTPSSDTHSECSDDELVYPDARSSGDDELYPQFVSTEEIPPLELSPVREHEVCVGSLLNGCLLKFLQTPFFSSDEGQAEISFNFNRPNSQLGLPGPVTPFTLSPFLFDGSGFASPQASFSFSLSPPPPSPIYAPDELMSRLERYHDEFYRTEPQQLTTLNDNPFFDMNGSWKDYVHGIFD